MTTRMYYAGTVFLLDGSEGTPTEVSEKLERPLDLHDQVGGGLLPFALANGGTVFVRPHTAMDLALEWVDEGA